MANYPSLTLLESTDCSYCIHNRQRQEMKRWDLRITHLTTRAVRGGAEAVAGDSSVRTTTKSLYLDTGFNGTSAYLTQHALHPCRRQIRTSELVMSGPIANRKTTTRYYSISFRSLLTELPYRSRQQSFHEVRRP